MTNTDERFYLFYPDETVELDDFIKITEYIQKLGTPRSIRYKVYGTDCLVDLQSGMFYINGKSFEPLTTDFSLFGKQIEYRPIWFRRWYRTFQTLRGEVAQECHYYLGFQVTLNGRNYKKMIRIAPSGSIGFC